MNDDYSSAAYNRYAAKTYLTNELMQIHFHNLPTPFQCGLNIALGKDTCMVTVLKSPFPLAAKTGKEGLLTPFKFRHSSPCESSFIRKPERNENIAHLPNTKIILGFLGKTFTASPIRMLTLGCLLNIEPLLPPSFSGDTLPLFVLPPQPILTRHIGRLRYFSRVSVRNHTPIYL